MADRVALVTGAAKRIGHAIASDLAKRGYAVAVHYNGSQSDADALVDELKANGSIAQAFQADLSDEAQTQALGPAVQDAFGPISLLVNNASLFEHDTVETATRDSWDAHLNANLRAPFILSQHMAANLPDGADGLIVNLIDQRVWKLTPQFMSYTLSKTGLWTLTQTLAQALAPRIRVNAIGPGPTLQNERQSEEHFNRQLEGVLLKRGPALDEITAAIQFFETAKAMTGQMIALDGGQHLAWETPDIVGIVE